MWKAEEPLILRVLRWSRNVLAALSGLIAFGTIVYALMPHSQEQHVQRAGLVWLLTVFLTLIAGCTWGLLGMHRRRRARGRRISVPVNDFIRTSARLAQLDSSFISIVRTVLGHMYEVDPDVIVPTDNADSLQELGKHGDPFGFEVVLGVAQRLKARVPEENIYPIVRKLHENARTVEDVIVILAQEFCGPK